MIREITLAAFFLFFAPAAANAAVTCTLSASGLAFGAFSGSRLSTVGSVTIHCTGTGNSKYTIALSTGSSGTYLPRQMTSGPDRLSYNLYYDAASTQIWGDGTGGSTVVSGKVKMNGAPSITVVVPVYGKLPAQTEPSSGGYSDSIVATMLQGGSTVTTSFLVTADVEVDCTVSATDLSFGNYTGAQLNSQSEISLTCSNAAPWSIGLNQGTFPGATIATRRMTGPRNFSLSYFLYRDAARTLNWGNTPGTDTVSGTGTGSIQTLTVYGRVPPSQAVVPGGYVDSIIAMITF